MDGLLLFARCFTIAIVNYHQAVPGMPYADRDRTRLYYGWLGDHTHSAPQFGHFNRRHRVISPDLRGHGLSDACGAHTIEAHSDDLVWLIEKLEPRRPVVIGHSLGGMVALQLAVDHPELVGAVVLLENGDLGKLLIEFGLGGVFSRPGCPKSGVSHSARSGSQ
jgi:pimeloyl-ACP methyl ester carboxylesterase